MNRYSCIVIACLLLLMGPLSSCFDESPNGDTADTNFDAPGDDSGGPYDCVIDPEADSDDDGLLDIYEDLNRNCQVDIGETDPHNPDTDGDGLLDGDEDADGNGIWDQDRGELNPLLRDTDGNGTPDAEEPKAQVCNRAHADAVLTERLILPGGRALYLHPTIATSVTGFENTNDVVLQGTVPGEGGMVFETKNRLPMMLNAIHTLVASNDMTPRANDHDVELWTDAEARTVRIRVPLSSPPDRDVWIDELKAVVPSFRAPVAITQQQQDDADGLEQPPVGEEDDRWGMLQVLGSASSTGSQWAIAWAPVAQERVWLNTVSPSLISEKEHQVVRFVCENVEVESTRALRVLLAVHPEADPRIRQQWFDAIQYMVSLREDQEVPTEIFALGTATGINEWTMVKADLLQGVPVAALANAPFWQVVEAALSIVPPTDPEDNVATILITIDREFPERSDNDAHDGFGDLLDPPLDQTIWVATEEDAASCFSTIQMPQTKYMPNIGQSGEMILWRTCGNHAVPSWSRALLTSWAYGRWTGPERRPIASTIRLADTYNQSSYPAYYAFWGRRPIVALTDIMHVDNSAVSFAAWYSKD